MSKRISTEKRTYNHRIASQRLKEYISENNLTCTSMSRNMEIAHVGVDRRTLMAICKGVNKEYMADIFDRISEFTGNIPEYWKGLTACKTPVEYEKELLATQKQKNDQTQLDLILRRQEQRRKDFFSMCGYQYKYLTPSEVDFGSLFEGDYSDATEQHCLSSFQHPGKRTYLNTDELNSLMKKIEETIGFVCYKKEVE